MDTLDLSPDELHQITLIGQRLLINESTHPDDLKAVLVGRLRHRQPSLADKIQQMGQIADHAAMLDHPGTAPVLCLSSGKAAI